MHPQDSFALTSDTPVADAAAVVDAGTIVLVACDGDWNHLPAPTPARHGIAAIEGHMQPGARS